jgi:hypothetical protein
LANDPVTHLAELTGSAISGAMMSGKAPGATSAEQQQSTSALETMREKLAELMSDMDKLAGASGPSGLSPPIPNAEATLNDALPAHSASPT